MKKMIKVEKTIIRGFAFSSSILAVFKTVADVPFLNDISTVSVLISWRVLVVFMRVNYYLLIRQVIAGKLCCDCCGVL
jgi:hypothetical protein